MENKGRNERGVYVEGGDAGGGGPPPWYANPLRDPKDSWVGFDLENIGENSPDSCGFFGEKIYFAPFVGSFTPVCKDCAFRWRSGVLAKALMTSGETVVTC